MQHNFVLTGSQPILFHADDVIASDLLNEWRKDPKNKGLSVPGDDRSPSWTWQVYLYHDGEKLAIPQENIMACLRKAATSIPKAKGKGTYKNESQSGILVTTEYCDFTSKGKPVSIAAVAALKDLSFVEQFEAVKKLGFELKVKRATVGSSKHVRVRAMFRQWEIKGSVLVNDPVITTEVLKQMFEIAGQKVGLLDWRPGSPKSPGPYGMFKAEVKAVK